LAAGKAIGLISLPQITDNDPDRSFVINSFAA
jgi:hypothetical protein